MAPQKKIKGQLRNKVPRKQDPSVYNVDGYDLYYTKFNITHRWNSRGLFETSKDRALYNWKHKDLVKWRTWCLKNNQR